MSILIPPAQAAGIGYRLLDVENKSTQQEAGMVIDSAHTGLARSYGGIRRSDGDKENLVLLRNNDVIQGPLQRICAARGRIQGHRHELPHSHGSDLRAGEVLPGAKGDVGSSASCRGPMARSPGDVEKCTPARRRKFKLPRPASSGAGRLQRPFR